MIQLIVSKWLKKYLIKTFEYFLISTLFITFTIEEHSDSFIIVEGQGRIRAKWKKVWKSDGSAKNSKGVKSILWFLLEWIDCIFYSRNDFLAKKLSGIDMKLPIVSCWIVW